MTIKKAVYLDHQASTPLDSAVFQEMLPYFTESFANPHSSDHALGWSAADAVNEAANRISKLLGCDNDEIIFVSGATEANNLAIFGLRDLVVNKSRDRIVTTPIEHKSVIATLRAFLKQFGVTVDIVRVDANGKIDLNHLEELVDDRTLLVSLGAVNSEIGSVQDIAGIHAVASQAGALLHWDAAQMPMASDMSNIADFADMVSLSAHKFYGPKGIGCLYVRRDLQDKLAPIIFGGGQQNGIRSGTLPVALCVGMGAAANLLQQSPNVRDELRSKSADLWQRLCSLPWEVRLNGAPLADRHPGNLNVMFPGFGAEELVGALQPSLAVSTGSACTSGIKEPSHVLRSIGLDEEQALASIRLSVGKSTTDENIADAVALISDVLSRFEAEGLMEAS